jgi:hypothetical protein
MKALISPNEPVVNYDGSTGYRVAEVVTQEFEVASPLFWTECPEDCVQDVWYYNTTTDTCEPKPVEPIPEVGE